MQARKRFVIARCFPLVILIAHIHSPSFAQTRTSGWHLTQAQSYLDQGDYASALREFKAASSQDSSLSGIDFRLGLCYWKLGKFAEARKAFVKDPANPYALYYLGRLALDQGNPDEAIVQFEEVLKAGPVLDVYFQLGSAQLRRNQLGLAIANLEKGVAQNPDQHEVRYSLGRAYALAGRKEEAEREFQRARDLIAEQQQAIRDFDQCETLLKQHQPEPALVLAHRLMESPDPDLLLNLGKLLGQYGLHRDAFPIFERAARLRPGFFEADYNEGVSLSFSRDFTHAVEPLQQAVRLRPYSYEAQSLLGLVLVQLGRDAEAIDPLRRAVELRPDDPRLVSLLGSTYLKQHDYQKASETLRKAVDLQPGAPQPRIMLIQAYRGLGKSEEADKENEILQQLTKSKRDDAR